jgi:hypothetical protein
MVHFVPLADLNELTALANDIGLIRSSHRLLIQESPPVCAIAGYQLPTFDRGDASMSCNCVGLLVVFVAISCLACEAQSADITEAVSQQCRWDYHKYCSEYGLGSSLLTLCFHKNGRNLSKGCVAALIQAGDVSKAYVAQQRKKYGR